MAQAMKEKVDDSSQFIDWEKRTDIRAQLKVQIILTLAQYNYPPSTRDEVFKAIFEQAENFKKNRTIDLDDEESLSVPMIPYNDEEESGYSMAAETRE